MAVALDLFRLTDMERRSFTKIIRKMEIFNGNSVLVTDVRASMPAGFTEMIESMRIRVRYDVVILLFKRVQKARQGEKEIGSPG